MTSVKEIGLEGIIRGFKAKLWIKLIQQQYQEWIYIFVNLPIS